MKTLFRKSLYEKFFFHNYLLYCLDSVSIIFPINLQNIFDFWLDKDVDGFCICGVSYLLENEDLLDESSSEEDTSDETDNDEDSDNDEESHTIGLPENADLLVRFREHIEEWVKEHNAEPKYILLLI